MTTCDVPVFILTHKRPNKQLTLDFLRAQGYTGIIYLVVDDLDPTYDEYISNYKDYETVKVLKFDKVKYSKITDTGLCEPILSFAVFARNAIEDFAKQFNYKYFIVADDDIAGLSIRVKDNNKLKNYKADDVNSIFSAIIEFMKQTGITTLSPVTNLACMSGVHYDDNPDNFNFRRGLCFFFRDITEEVHWGLNMLEDDSTTIHQARSGKVWVAIKTLQCNNAEFFGVNEGGNSDVYRNHDLPSDAWFPVLKFPDSCKLAYHNGRLLTNKSYNTLIPKIISSRFKKFI